MGPDGWRLLATPAGATNHNGATHQVHGVRLLVWKQILSAPKP